MGGQQADVGGMGGQLLQDRVVDGGQQQVPWVADPGGLCAALQEGEGAGVRRGSVEVGEEREGRWVTWRRRSSPRATSLMSMHDTCHRKARQGQREGWC